MIIIGGVLADIGKAFWSNASESKVTAGQVVNLSGQTNNLSSQVDKLSGALSTLNDKIGSLPSTREMGTLTARVDKTESKIDDLYNITTGLRHDVDNRLPPLVFRNPK